MLGWMHLELNFKIKDFPAGTFPQKKPKGTYKELMIYLKKVVDSSLGLINRYFFLFEPDPHLFLALEAKDTNNFYSIRDRINKIKKPAFVDSFEVKFNTGDGGHPEGALDLFYASTKYAFFRVTGAYKPGYANHDETKIIHCFCNQLFIDHDKERFFYLKGAKNSGLRFSQAYARLRDSAFPGDIAEFLFWDLAVNKFIYKGQRVYIFKRSGKEFYYTIEYRHRVDNNVVQDLSDAIGVFLSQKGAKESARGAINKNLSSGDWITKAL